MDIKATPYSHLKIFHHADLLKKIERGERVAPIYIRIKPTNFCNENCYYCHYKNPYLKLDEYKPTDFIPREKMLEIIEDLREIGTKAVTFSGGGEPLVYPYITETMQKVLDSEIDLSIISNGMLLKDENAEILAKAKWVRLSIDSCRAELYSKLRGVPLSWFDMLCKNIETFAKIKNLDCELGVNFVVSKDNYDDILGMATLMKSLGVNHIKFAPMICNETEKYHLPFKQRVMNDIARARNLEDKNFRIIDLYTSDFSRVDSGIRIFNRAYKTCYMKFLVCVIAADQKIYHCHDKAYLANGIVGDLKNGRFKDIWFNEDVVENANKFDARRFCTEHCVYDDRNIMLNQYFSIGKSHINFL